MRWDGDAWASEVGEPWSDKKGKKRRREVRFAFGPAERERALAAMLAYRERQRAVEDSPLASIPTIAVIQAYLQWSAENADPRTHRGYDEILPKFYLWETGDGTRLGELPAWQVQGSHLEAIVESMTAAGNSPHYIDRLVKSVKRVWAWAARPNPARTPPTLVSGDPFAQVKRPRIPRSPERYLKKRHVEEFLRWAYWSAKRKARGAARNRFIGSEDDTLLCRFDRIFVLMIRFIRMTGCRPDEAARARWSDLDLGRGTLTIRGKLTSRTGMQRVVFLTPRLVRMLEGLEKLPGRHPEFIFTHKRGKFHEARGASDPLAGEPYLKDAIQNKLRGLRKRAIEAGLPVEDKGPNRLALYGLRHTRISDDLMAGGDLPTIAAIHNTSVDQIQKTYGHLLQGHLARANEELSERARRKK